MIDRSEFARNGHGDGQSHNLYIGEANRLIVTASFFHNAKIGHNFKSRARETHIEKRGEGVVIAFPRSLDQVSLVHGRLGGPVGTPTVDVLDRVWRPCLLKGSVAPGRSNGGATDEDSLRYGATRCQEG